jgi:hypothetical protein
MILTNGFCRFRKKTVAHSPSIPQLPSTSASSITVKSDSKFKSPSPTPNPKVEVNFRESSFNKDSSFRSSPVNMDFNISSFSASNLRPSIGDRPFPDDSFVNKSQKSASTPSSPFASLTNSKTLPTISTTKSNINTVNHLLSPTTSPSVSVPVPSSSAPSSTPNGKSNGFLGGSDNLSLENLVLPDFYLHDFSSTGSFKFTNN